MKKRDQALSAILAFAMAMNLALVPVCATESASYQDGTYTGTATVHPDEDEDFDPYDINVAVEIKDGVISAVAYAEGNDFDGNDTYAKRAMDGTKKITGLASQILTVQSTEGIDTVSGATCTSNAILTAVNAALEQAKAMDNAQDKDDGDQDNGNDNDNEQGEEKDPSQGDDEEKDPEAADSYYVLMNIPYRDFYAAEGTSEQVDVISTATTSKFKGTTGLAKGTYNDGVNISGVAAYPVLMDADTYEILKDKITDDSADYYFTLCNEKPVTYKTLTYANGAYNFSQATGAEKSAEGLSVGNLTTTSKYGSYQIDLVGVGTDGTIGDEEDVTISGVILTTSDGKHYPMYTLENVWLGTKVENVEIAWSVQGAPEVYKNHGSGPAFHQYDMNGKTLTNVKLITSAGIYNIPCNVALTPYYDGEVTMTATDATTVSVSGLPTDIENAKASVYYTTGSGRDTQTVYLAQDAAVVNGSITLDTAMEAEPTYTVSISSDNYAQITGTVTVEEAADSYYVLMNIPYSDFYKAELNNNVAVDAVSSATLNKTRTSTLVGGSYHVNSDGSDITGITFPVKVSSLDDLAKLTQITDESSVTIQVTNRGQTSETTYTGSDALFESASYSYYILSEVPDYYKELTVGADGSFSFGKTVGEATEIDATATITTASSYGDYQVEVEGLPSNISEVYAVVLSTGEADYGLRHLENVWRTSELAWCTGHTAAVHGSATSSDHYQAMEGQTIQKITYITDAGIYSFDCDLYVTPYYNGEVTYTAEDATTVSVSGLPDDIKNAKASVSYTIGSGRTAETVYLAQDVEVVNGSITLDTAMEAEQTYTVSISSDNYAQITGTVTMEEAAEAEYTYLYAALTWDEYWASENVYAAGSTASSTELDTKGETDKGAFDVVSRATANHGLHRGSFQSVAVIYDTDGNAYTVSYWTNSDNAVLNDGRTLTKSSDRSTGITSLTLSDGTSATMDYYLVTGIKYVPVQVATEDLAAFCQQYTVVLNGQTLAGGYSEQNLSAYTATAAVDETTNGLKVATKNSDGTFSFSARSTGTGSGLADTTQKTVNPDNITVTVKEASGSFGEFLRVDLTGSGYGDLGSNMYAVVWTYYGDDSTYTTALQSYGTKFAADNWMHKSMGIQLGLTDSLRCQLPEGTDGTGYWTITVCAMGYEDYTIPFQATEDNIVKTEEEEQVDASALEALVAQAKALTESDYTADSWKDLATELSESVEMLASDTLTQAMVDEQVKHLTEALNSLVKAEQPDEDDKSDGDNSDASDDSNPGDNDASDDANTGDNDASNDANTGDNDQTGNDTADATAPDSDGSQNTTDKTNPSTDSNGETTVVKTADESHMLLWLGALVLSCLGFTGMVMFTRKKQD